MKHLKRQYDIYDGAVDTVIAKAPIADVAEDAVEYVILVKRQCEEDPNTFHFFGTLNDKHTDPISFFRVNATLTDIGNVRCEMFVEDMDELLKAESDSAH